MKYLCFVLGLTLFSLPALSEEVPAQTSRATVEFKTVFVGVSAFNRRKGAAKKLTGLYAAEAEAGWRLSDLDLYIEDNDLEGFFVTFERDRLPDERLTSKK